MKKTKTWEQSLNELWEDLDHAKYISIDRV